MKEGHRTIFVTRKAMKEERNAQTDSSQLSLQLLIGDVSVRHGGQRLKESIIQYTGIFSRDRVMWDLW